MAARYNNMESRGLCVQDAEGGSPNPRATIIYDTQWKAGVNGIIPILFYLKPVAYIVSYFYASFR